MQPGTPVEIFDALGYGMTPTWHGDYVYVGDGFRAGGGDVLENKTRGTVLVAYASGIFAGCEVRYKRSIVRAKP